MQLIDVLNKLREIEKTNESVRDAIDSAKRMNGEENLTEAQRLYSVKLENDKGVTKNVRVKAGSEQEAKDNATMDPKFKAVSARVVDAPADDEEDEDLEESVEQGVAEGNPNVERHTGDKTVRVVRRGGKPIGEIGIDAEASPGQGQYYVKLYDGSVDLSGYDTAAEALKELRWWAMAKADKALSEEEGRPYVCAHAKKGTCEVTANSSYEAAQKAAKKWELKSTAGIDVHVADKPKDPASLNEMDSPGPHDDPWAKGVAEGSADEPVYPDEDADDKRWDDVNEGTWALPNTPEAQAKLDKLMSKELIVGIDATNAVDQLYSIIGDDKLFDILHVLAKTDPDANVWDDTNVQNRLKELGIQMNNNNTPELSEIRKLSGIPEAKLDPVGQEDDDINNDGETNSTDDYLKNRREKIAKSMKESVDLTECGMMPENVGMMHNTPATITMTATASSGSEVSSMLKDILTLAGQSSHADAYVMDGGCNMEEDGGFSQATSGPNEFEAGIEQQLDQGDDLHKPHEQHAAMAKLGDNPMASEDVDQLAESLWKQFNNTK